jgi:C-terminal processing protease CtpA/Prc
MGKRSLIAAIPTSISLVALCLLLPSATQAADRGGLVSESASLDMASAEDAQSPTPTSNTTTLYGSVRKRQAKLEATDAAGASLNATENDAQLQSEKAKDDAQRIFALAIKKLAAGEELSSEEYRSLGVGCVGFESTRTLFKEIGRITAVYRDFPAQQAGIRKGDRIISDSTDEEAKANPQQPRYQVTFAQAGTSAQINILRHGHPVTYTLTRMNVEDIQEPEIRQRWEDIIRRLGFPKEGAFTGTSLQDLKLNPNIGTDKL